MSIYGGEEGDKTKYSGKFISLVFFFLAFSTGVGANV